VPSEARSMESSVAKSSVFICDMIEEMTAWFLASCKNIITYPISVKPDSSN